MVRRRVKRLLFCWVAVSACLWFTACGGKKGPRPVAPVPASTPEPSQDPGPEAEQDTTAQDSRSPRRPEDSSRDEYRRKQNELNRYSGRSAQERRRDRDNGYDDENTGGADERRHGENGGRRYRVRGEPRVVFDPDKFRSPRSGSSSDGPRSVFDDAPVVNREPVRRGPVNNQLIYSGSAEDNIVGLLRDRMDKVADENQRIRNQEFANQLGHTTVHFADGTSDFEVTALINQTHYKFHGSLNADFRGTFHGSQLPGVSGELSCLSLHGGCYHMALFFRDEAQQGHPRYAYVVVRDTPAKLSVRTRHPGDSNNPEFLRLLKIFKTAERNSGKPINPNKPEQLTFLNLLTSETVNGMASFAVKMQFYTPCRGYQEQNGIQTATWVGPLKMTADGSPLDLHVSTAPSVTRLAGTLTEVDPYEGRVSDSIKMTRLIDNNGKGGIKLHMKVRAIGHYEEENITLTVSRMHSEVRYDLL